MKKGFFPKMVSIFFVMILTQGVLTGCEIPREILPFGEPTRDLKQEEKEKKENEAESIRISNEIYKTRKPYWESNPNEPKLPDEKDIDLVLNQAVPEEDPIEIFNNNNIKTVMNGGTSPQFTTDKDVWMTELGSYHWNNGAGAPAGTLSIQSVDGKTSYGPWKAELSNLGGKHDVYWIAKPNAWLPAGSYRVIDSDPSTWAQNSDTGGQGIAWMKGIKSNPSTNPK